jgi:hypothetical protein
MITEIKKVNGYVVQFDHLSDVAHLFRDEEYYLSFEYSLVPNDVAKDRILGLLNGGLVKEPAKLCTLDFSAPTGSCST